MANYKVTLRYKNGFKHSYDAASDRDVMASLINIMYQDFVTSISFTKKKEKKNG